MYNLCFVKNYIHKILICKNDLNKEYACVRIEAKFTEWNIKL